MSPREESWEPPTQPSPPRDTSPVHWLALVLTPAVGPAWWWYGLPGPWWAPSAVTLAVAVLGAGPRRVLWTVLWVWAPGRRCLLGLVAAAVGVVAWESGNVWARVTVCVLPALSGAVLAAPRLRRDYTTEGDDLGFDPGWAGRVEAEWPAIARAAGLVGAGESGAVAPLLQPPAEPSPAALELRVGLAEVRLLPEDVRRAEGALRRQLRAPWVRVRAGSDDGADVALVRAYRRHPMAVPVSWRDVHPVEDPSGEWCPVGVDEWGGIASVRWRIPLLIAGAQESGKTVLVRAGIRGAALQRIPVRWWFWDNRADFLDLRPVAHRHAVGWADGLALLEELDAGLSARIASTAGGYEWTPTLADPAEVLIVGELLTALEGPPGASALAKKVRVEVPRLIRRRVIDQRAMAHGTWAAAQVANKEGPLERVRDLFPQKAACRLEGDHLVNPALGPEALENGAAPHEIPAALQGVSVLINPLTRAPVEFRSGFIPPEDSGRAVVEPYRRLMGRHLTVIEGDAG